MSDSMDNQLDPNSPDENPTDALPEQPESRFKISSKIYSIVCLVLGLVFVAAGAVMWLLSKEGGERFISFVLVIGCGAILLFIAISGFRREKNDA